MELTEELKRQYQNHNQSELNRVFLWACGNGHFNIVRYLLTSPELQEHADIHADDDNGLGHACKNGHLEVVKYLLTSPDLKEHADIHAWNDYGFLWACGNGQLEVVQYLLTSPELSEHVDIHAWDDEGLIYACESGHLEVVKYLLTSPDLQDHANIHADKHKGFRCACKKAHLDIVQYLLSLDGDQRIDFQKTDYNLEWAIENKYSDIVFTMITHLHRHDIDVFNAHVDSVMAYFMGESFEHSVAMMNEFHLSSTELTTECNLVL